MATRATYEIENHLFYIHHDGYPQGAAKYLLEALCEFNMGRGTPPFEEAFARSNKKAEPIWSHDAHSDTEYRYIVKTVPYQLDETDMTKMIRVDKKSYNKLTGLSYWATDYFGTLEIFISEQNIFQDA